MGTIYRAAIEPQKFAATAVFSTLMPHPAIARVLYQTAARIASGEMFRATASGPAASLLLAVRRVGWTRRRDFQWRHVAGLEFELSVDSPNEVCKIVASTVLLWQWKWYADSSNGASLQYGGTIHALNAIVHGFSSFALTAHERRYMLSVTQPGQWSQSRLLAKTVGSTDGGAACA